MTQSPQRSPSRPFLALILLMLAACGAPPPAAESRLADLAGQPVSPLTEASLPSTSVLVLVFMRSDCPISNRYAPELERLYRKFEREPVRFWLVYLDPDEVVDKVRQQLEELKLSIPALTDPDHELVAVTGAEVTPSVAVFVEREMVYLGRIDNRYVDFGKTRAAPTKHDLEDVLSAITAGETLQLATTPAVGCFIADLR